MKIKNKSEKVRFGIVGIINTAIDFGLFFLLKLLGFPTIPANVLGSTSAFVTSFILNKKVTFQTSKANLKREVLLFIVITLFGLWVIQSTVIVVFEWLLKDIFPLYGALLIAKIVATCITLVWNYVMYSRVVFKSS